MTGAEAVHVFIPCQIDGLLATPIYAVALARAGLVFRTGPAGELRMVPLNEPQDIPTLEPYDPTRPEHQR